MKDLFHISWLNTYRAAFRAGMLIVSIIETMTGKKELTYPLPNEPIDSLKARTVFPDIIIHHRNTKHNLLIIEMKKDANSDGDEEEKDKNKLRAFLKPPYCYQYGLLIAFGNDGGSRLEWFERHRDCDAT